MWRYKLVRLNLRGWEPSELGASEAQLNELGGDGWEAVAVIGEGDTYAVLLKMPREVGTF
jgi:hypothetical protein